jgi:hypothetical protein
MLLRYKIMVAIILPVLILASLVGVASAVSNSYTTALRSNNRNGGESLENVRAYAPAVQPDGLSYANAGGQLLAGSGKDWQKRSLPPGVIAGGVAVDPLRNQTIYVGAANETAIYRSIDGGANWLRLPLSQEYAGAVTTIAIDSAQRLVYAGTDQGMLFRLRDVESSVVLAGQKQFDTAILQIATDSTGAGLAFVRTQWQLFQAENNGLAWQKVETLFGGAPTALAIANTSPATVYVGTTDMGLLRSSDGKNWFTANDGLGVSPGSRLQIDALAINPLQPEVLYVATSYLFGSTQIHQSPVGVAISDNGAQKWSLLHSVTEIAISDLFPISGQSRAVYALFSNSRTPYALGEAASLVASAPQPSASWWNSILVENSLWAWIVAMAAAVALLIVITLDQHSRRQEKGFMAQPVHTVR